MTCKSRNHHNDYRTVGRSVGRSVGRAGALAVAGLAALLVSGCEPSWYDFRVYDDLADQAWVSVSEPPDDVGGLRYGWNIAGGATSDAGASFLVAGTQPDGFALVRFDNQGAITTQALSLLAINSLEQPNTWSARPAMAGSPNGNLIAASMSNGGSPTAPTQATIALLDATTGQPAGLFSMPGALLIDDLTFASTNVAVVVQDNVAALRGGQLGIVSDINDPAAPVPECAHGFTVPLGVESADLHPAAVGDEIILAVADAASPAQVFILSGSVVSAAAATATPPDVAPCFDATRTPLETIDPPGGETDFGSGMVVGDFNGTGVPDLAIGASATGTVYVYIDVDLSVGLPTPIVIDGPPGAIGFGSQLHAGDVYLSDGADELIVAMPNTTVEGQLTAGMVHVYDYGEGAFAAPIVLHDAQPEGDTQYGQGVAVVPFGPDRDILVVGTKNELFTYFRIHPSDPDPRAGVGP